MAAGAANVIECPGCKFTVPIGPRCPECNYALTPMSPLPQAGITPQLPPDTLHVPERRVENWWNFDRRVSGSPPAAVPRDAGPNASGQFIWPTPPIPPTGPPEHMVRTYPSPGGQPPLFTRAPPRPQNELLTKFGFGSIDTRKFSDATRECLSQTLKVSGRTSKDVFGAYLAVMLVLAGGITFFIMTIRPVLYTTKFVNVNGFLMPMPAFDWETFNILLLIGAAPVVLGLVPLTTAAIRRLHDTGRSGGLVGVAYGVYAVSAFVTANGSEAVRWVALLASVATMFAMTYFLSRPGDPAPNANGMPPVT